MEISTHPPRAFARVLAAFLALAIPSCDEAGEAATESPLTIEGRAMGTTWRVLAIAPDADPDALTRETSDLLDSLERKFSHYREDSEISRFNQAAAHVAVPVSAETARLVAYGEQMRKDTDGAFDIRIARTVARRGFGPDALADQDQAHQSPAGSLRVTHAPPSLTKDSPSLAIDLSAYAKGYAVDRVSTLLEEQGIRNYLVEIGGELKAKGTKEGGNAWSIGVEAPCPGERALHLGVTLGNKAIASSGNYRLFREKKDGQLESHLVDPRGELDRESEPVFRSVSVILPDAMGADAWATALFVLGGSDGPRLARERSIPACFLRLKDDGQVEELLVAGFEQTIFR